MNISEITALLQKAAQVAGDVEVGLHDVTGTVDHVLQGVSVIIAADGSGAQVGLVHGPAPESQRQEGESGQPADPAAGAASDPANG